MAWACRALVIALAASAAACQVQRKTDSLRCATNDDCTAPRTCEMGYCVVGGGGGCPDACNQGCDLSASPPTCRADLGGGADFTCPDGMHCDITCSSPGACDTLHCGGAASCTIGCSAMGACNDIHCGSANCNVECSAPGACAGTIACGSNGTGRCIVDCNGASACSDVECSNACACDVTCESGGCGTNSCPMRGNTACTTDGSTTGACTSMLPGCDSC